MYYIHEINSMLPLAILGPYRTLEGAVIAAEARAFDRLGKRINRNTLLQILVKDKEQNTVYKVGK